MANFATYDFAVRQIAVLGQEKFLSTPTAFHDLFHFTPTDVHEPYELIDPVKNAKLSQEGKVVLITGASRGIGRGIAISFAKANAKAIVLTARDKGRLEEVAKEIRDAYPNTKVLVQPTDVTSESDVKTAFTKAIEAFGAVDVAIHNAGLNHDVEPLPKTTLDVWWTAFEVHVRGLYLVAREFITHLEGKPGTLIHISSSSSVGAIPHQTSYGPSKLAANRLIEHLQFGLSFPPEKSMQELTRISETPNLRSFNLHPGVVDTDLTRNHHVLDLGWVMDSPELSGGVSLWLTTPEAEFLRGRWIAANWKVDELKAIEEKIVHENLLVSAFNAKLGTK